MHPQLPPDGQNLVLEHMGLAKGLALSLARKLSLRPDLYDEVISLANEGLAEAASRYDPRRGTAFSTFAYYRIRGAVYDGLRAMGVLGKRQRSQALLEQRTDETMEQASATAPPPSGPPPTVEETIQNIANNVADLTTVHMVCMDVEGLAEPPESGPDAQELAILKEMSDVLHDAIENLPDAERQIIELAYFKDMSLKEAGEKMGLSRSWACRLHSRAVRLLRGAMRGME